MSTQNKEVFPVGPVSSYTINTNIYYSTNATYLHVGTMFLMSKAVTIDSILITPSVKYGTGGTYTVGIYGVQAGGSSYGEPDYTTVHAEETGQTFTSGTQGEWFTLSPTYTTSIGQYVSIIAKNTEAAPNTDYNRMILGWNKSGFGRQQAYYSANGTSWTRINGYEPSFSLRATDGEIFGVGAIKQNTSSWLVDGVNYITAMKIVVPSIGRTLTCLGIETNSQSLENTGTYNFGCRDASGSEVGSTIKSYEGNLGYPNDTRTAWYFATPLTMSPGSTYYIGWQQTDAAEEVNELDFEFDDTTDRDNTMFWTDCHLSSHDTTSWTDYTTRAIPISLICDGLSTTGGAGGLLTNPGTSGGARG